MLGSSSRFGLGQGLGLGFGMGQNARVLFEVCQRLFHAAVLGSKMVHFAHLQGVGWVQS